jgi:hypothetical protein
VPKLRHHSEAQKLQITQSSLTETGLGELGDVEVIDSEFADDKPLFNYPFDAAGAASRSRMTLTFVEPVNKVAILYAAASGATRIQTQ